MLKTAQFGSFISILNLFYLISLHTYILAILKNLQNHIFLIFSSFFSLELLGNALLILIIQLQITQQGAANNGLNEFSNCWKTVFYHQKTVFLQLENPFMTQCASTQSLKGFLRSSTFKYDLILINKKKFAFYD